MRVSILGRLTVLSLAVLMSSCSSAPVIYDMLILDGTIIDGSGSPAYKADINIFDFDTVSDNEDWAHPHQYATGFSYVIVGGIPVIEEGVRTAAFPGKVLKRTKNG